MENFRFSKRDRIRESVGKSSKNLEGRFLFYCFEVIRVGSNFVLFFLVSYYE